LEVEQWVADPLARRLLHGDIAYFGANLTKVPDGGWFPLLIGLIAFTFLTTWARGRKLMIGQHARGAMPVEIFVKSAANSATRVPGTAVS
jgi:KUP system potassium uptake protein